MDRVFATLPKGAEAEIYHRTTKSAEVRFSSNEFEGVAETKTQAHALRLIREGRIAQTTSSKPGSEEALLHGALDIVKYGAEVGYSFPGPSDYREMELWSGAVPPMGLKEMAEVGEDLFQALRRHDPRLLVMAGVGRDEHEVSLQNSHGLSGSYKITEWSAFLGAELVQGDDFLWIGEGLSSWTTDLDYEAIKREVIEQFQWASNTVGMAPGSYPVIFAPSQVGFLMTPFMACMNGKAIARGISPLVDKIGEPLVDPRITIVDDGTLLRDPSSAPFDREGIPTRRNILVDKGSPKDVLHDLQTAKELGAEPTGNGAGGGPAPHHVIVEPGDESLPQMIKSIDKGILLLGSMGAWTGNPYGGNVAGTISMGLKIDKGQVVGRIKDCMFSLNVFEHLNRSLVSLSKETKRGGGGGPGSMASTFPYMLIDDVVVTTK